MIRLKEMVVKKRATTSTLLLKSRPCLQELITEFEAAGRALNMSVAQAIASNRLNAATAERVNQSLIQVERNWCNPDGIPGRPWFKHTIHAARYTYAHLELPGITEAAEAGNWKLAAAQAKIFEDELEKNTELLRQIKQELDSSSVIAKP
jgi:N-acetylated-alpha-linked acidic dipeptidase